MADTPPTKAEYDQARQHMSDHPDLYAVEDPTDEVLANVQLINEYDNPGWLQQQAEADERARESGL